MGDADIAVWRGVSGKLSAWLNRCPHRGMRLSHGFVRGESLACLYHGWHYGSDGVCNYIPAHPDLEPPGTIQTTVFSIIDQDGVLWVSVDGAAGGQDLPGDSKPVRSITFSCSAKAAKDALIGSSVADGSGGELSIHDIAEGSNRLEFKSANGLNSVVVLLQQPSDQSMIAHILAAGDWSVDGMIGISRWSETVRRQAERTKNVPNSDCQDEL